MNRNFDNIENISTPDNKTQTDDIDMKIKFVESINRMNEKKETTESGLAKLTEKDSIQRRFQPIAEKAATIITVVDAIADPINNYVEPNIPQTDIKPIPSSYSTQAYDYMDSSIEDILLKKGYLIQEGKGSVETLGDIIETVGSDEDEALKPPEEIKEEIDEAIESSIIDNNTPKIERLLPEKEKSASSCNDVLNESNSDIAGQSREVPECGLSCLMSYESYEKICNGEYGKYGQVIGRDDGLFAAPTDQINQLLEECDEDVSKISEKLGVDFDSENLVRISISKEDADKLHPTYPTGRESGANEYWSGGGKTVLVDKETNKEIGVGLDEFVIDPVDLNEVGVQVTEINGYKSYTEE